MKIPFLLFGLLFRASCAMSNDIDCKDKPFQELKEATIDALNRRDYHFDGQAIEAEGVQFDKEKLVYSKAGWLVPFRAFSNEMPQADMDSMISCDGSIEFVIQLLGSGAN
jgi:hypothetical protein